MVVVPVWFVWTFRKAMAQQSRIQSTARCDKYISHYRSQYLFALLILIDHGTGERVGGTGSMKRMHEPNKEET